MGRPEALASPRGGRGKRTPHGGKCEAQGGGLTDASGGVRFANVSLAYDGQDAFAVEDITLAIAPGEFVAIVGPSGCGKSTFMKLATGLKPPTKGQVAVDGRPVTGPLKIVGMAFQAPTLLPWRTMLDEPFGALDAFTREELWCVLRDLWQERRFTVILVTHDLREAVFLADTVYVMSKRPGRIVAKREIALPRPRDLEVTYSETFTAIVHDLREQIGLVRNS